MSLNPYFVMWAPFFENHGMTEPYFRNFGCITEYVFLTCRYLQAECALRVPEPLMYVARPPTDCSVCNVTHSVDRLSNITPEEFEARYAYSGMPNRSILTCRFHR